MLNEAAEYFQKMFSTNFKEGIEGSGVFPEDDVEAWEELIEWCYRGKLGPLQLPTTAAMLTPEQAHPCTVRVKLCCLAEKYGMDLLKNLGVDSIVMYLKDCGSRARLEWDVLKDWFRYTYQNTHGSSGLRHLMGAPWGLTSCFFHNHLEGTKLSCPRSLTADRLQNGANDRISSILYKLLSMTLEGNTICNVAEAARELEKNKRGVVAEVDTWVKSGMMEWVDDCMTFKLVPLPAK